MKCQLFASPFQVVCIKAIPEFMRIVIFIADDFLINSSTQNLSRNEYTNGRWRLTKNESELDLFERIGGKLSDLLLKVTMRKLLSSSGAYENIELSSEELESKMKVERKDYYHNLKSYCLSLRDVT